MNLLDFWNNGGGRSLPLTDEIKDLFFLTSKLNILLKLAYVPSESNDGDAPSRFSSDLDCCLFESSWELLDKVFGPHTFDLTAIPSNVRRDSNGVKFPFFPPHPFSESLGVDVFAQQLSMEQKYYVFSPFILISPLLKFLKCKCSRLTVVAPDVSPKKYWWPILNSMCTERLLMGKKNEQGVILFPPGRGQGWYTRPLPWDLYAFRLVS